MINHILQQNEDETEKREIDKNRKGEKVVRSLIIYNFLYSWVPFAKCRCIWICRESGDILVIRPHNGRCHCLWGHRGVSTGHLHPRTEGRNIDQCTYLS